MYPEYLGLLERDDIWSVGEDLFGQKFLKHLVEEANKSQATLAAIAKKKAASHRKDQPAASTSQQRKPIDYSNSSSRNGMSHSPLAILEGGSLVILIWGDGSRVIHGF